MPVHNIFSKRQKKIRGELPDVYLYDRIPNRLRIQIIRIIRNAFHTRYVGSQEERYYEKIYDILCHEYGIFQLYTDSPSKPVPDFYRTLKPGDTLRTKEDKGGDIFKYFLHDQPVENVLDVIELMFRYMPAYLANQSDANDAVQELNARFKEHGVGYCFANGEIIRIDSQYLHSEAVKPALDLLGQKRYAGAQAEFMQAHKHYRDGNGKEAINECLKALESTMKSICKKRGWRYDEKAGANKLIGICFDNGLVPAYWRSHFDALRSTLESGVPTARNRLSGHGQGETPTAVPAHIAGYVLHMTAAAIVFLAEAEASGDE